MLHDEIGCDVNAMIVEEIVEPADIARTQPDTFRRWWRMLPLQHVLSSAAMWPHPNQQCWKTVEHVLVLNKVENSMVCHLRNRCSDSCKCSHRSRTMDERQKCCSGFHEHLRESPGFARPRQTRRASVGCSMTLRLVSPLHGDGSGKKRGAVVNGVALHHTGRRKGP